MLRYVLDIICLAILPSLAAAGLKKMTTYGRVPGRPSMLYYAVIAMMLTMVVSFLSVFALEVQAGPLVREVTSSPVPYSQVIVAQDGSRDISLILDREEYDPLDVTGVALIRVRSGRKRLDDLRVRLQLHNSRGQPVLKEELRELRGEHLDVTLALERVRLGNYTLHAVLADRAGARLAEATAPLRKRVKRKQLHEPDRQQVAVRVWPAEGAMESDWPIMTGVPFPQGVLFDQNRVRLLDEHGREVPCQTSVRSRWNRHGSIRWLGLDFIGRLATPGARYTLEFGRQVRRGPATKAVTVEEDAAAVRVDTGPLRFAVRKRGFNLLDEVRLNGSLISRQDAKAGLELTDHEGNVYRASNDPNVRVSVEKTGPVRTTIRATGWYVKDGTSGERLSPILPTDRLCRHDTRITAYAGKPYLTVQHVLVVTFDTHKVRLWHIGIGQRVEGASAGEFGLDGKAVAVPQPGRQSVRLYQPASVDGQVEQGDPSRPDFRVVKKGKRGDGWVWFAAAGGGLTLCVADFWQLYPKELELVGDRLSLSIWPRYGRTYTGVNPMDLSEIYKGWWCHTGRELAFQLPKEVYEKEKTVWPEGGEDVYEPDRLANAQGVAIENNFLLGFSATGDQAQAARLNTTYQYSPHAWADPEWVCNTEVFGRMIARDVKRFPTAEAYLEHAVALRLAAQDYARDYGMFNYQCIHSDDSHFNEGRWGLDRVWKDHHGGPRMPWLLYARSGDPKHLQFARRNSRHVMNVDTVHYVTPGYDLSPEKSRLAEEYGPRHRVGAHYGCYGLQHWGDRPCVACMWVNGEYDQLFWNYYATGNRRALDVAMEWVEAIKKTRFAGETGREFSSIGAELMEAYQATWDAGLLEILDNVARAIGAAHFHFEGDRKRGNHWLNMAPFVDRYLPFTGNENYRKRTLEWALDNSPYDSPRANTQALKYYETGDVSHLKECLDTVFFMSLRYSTEPPRISEKSYMYGWLKTNFRVIQWPLYLRALSDAGIPLFVEGRQDQPFPPGGRVVEQAGNGKARSVCVLRPGRSANFADAQVWYFRTAPDQKRLELRVVEDNLVEAGIHIRTRDGSRIVAHLGADGRLVGSGGTLKAAVKPNTLYYMAISGEPTLTAVGHPLILAPSAEDWFDPADASRTSGD